MPKPETYFIDTNIPMYAAGADHPMKAPCVAILEAAARGKLEAATDAEVLQEILHRYTALNQRVRALEICRLFMEVIPNIFPITSGIVASAIEIHRKIPALQARDSVHTAVMFSHNINHIISADRHFDAVSGVVRIDPLKWRG
jgi:predicted nucleic acid-binding protein